MRLNRSMLPRPIAAALLAGFLPGVFALAEAPRSPQQSTPSQLPMCALHQLTLSTDDENGNFAGMSHNGTLLVVKNTGSDACRLAAIPQITFLAHGKPLMVKSQVKGARFMHPGPVVLPIVLAGGAEVSATLYWVAGPVYDHSVCVQPDSVALHVQGQQGTTGLKAQICGPSANEVSVEVSRFSPDRAHGTPASSAPSPPTP